MAEKILIVDDDLDSLKLIGLMLQRQGYEISAAHSGAQALAKAASEQPNLVILDIMMPDMDGYEVCRRLRGNSATTGIPIIMFTAKTLVDDKVAGFEAGADDYLTKPTHPAELASRVKAIIGRSPGGATPQTPGNQGMLVSVMGVRGGVGTTTVATSLAALLNRVESTILADFRPGQGSMALALGMTRATGLATLATKSPTELDSRVVGGEVETHKAGFKVLLSSARPREAQLDLTPEVGRAILQQLRAMSKLVILDIGTGITAVNQDVLKSTTQLIVVLDPTRISLMMTRALLSELDELGLGQGRTSLVMVNRVHSSLQVSWQEAEQLLGRSMQAVISPSPELAFQANEASMPLVTIQPGAVLTTQYQKLAEELAGHLQIG